MTRAELLELFREFASEVAEKDYAHVSEDLAIHDLRIDSLGMLEIIAQMERRLEWRISDERIAQADVRTIKDFLDAVEECLKDPKLRIYGNPHRGVAT